VVAVDAMKCRNKGKKIIGESYISFPREAISVPWKAVMVKKGVMN